MQTIFGGTAAVAEPEDMYENGGTAVFWDILARNREKILACGLQERGFNLSFCIKWVVLQQ
jgi:hypothetical protein